VRHAAIGVTVEQYRALTVRHDLRFSAPLAVTWLMMPLEGAFRATVIARLDGPKFNLAAFGVAFSFAMLRARAVMHIAAPRRHTIHDYGAVFVPPLTADHVLSLVGRALHGNRRRRRAPCGYSWRRASMGSRREARHAG
jgi:hypothetical protein